MNMVYSKINILLQALHPSNTDIWTIFPSSPERHLPTAHCMWQDSVDHPHCPVGRCASWWSPRVFRQPTATPPQRQHQFPRSSTPQNQEEGTRWTHSSPDLGWRPGHHHWSPGSKPWLHSSLFLRTPFCNNGQFGKKGTSHCYISL